MEENSSSTREATAALRGHSGTLAHGANFTLDTRFGPLDILGDPAGAPPYARLRDAAGEELVVEGVRIRVASLDHLIAMKEAAEHRRTC